jgi:hypothetical protein
MRPLLATTVLVILLLAGAAQLPPELLSSMGQEAVALCSPNQRPSNERLAECALKTLASAQAVFRANDRDGDGVNQFWRGDLAGFHHLLDPRGSKLNLIPVELAAADDYPIGRLRARRPLHGYWFRAIHHPDEDPRSPDPQRFAVVAFPAHPRAGKYMFIIDENNSIRRCPAVRPDGIDIYPTDEELKQFWSRA